MHALRTSSILARLVLAWFALMLAVAGASPIIHPTKMEMVCTATSIMKIIIVSDDGQTVDAGQHTFDCSLCLAVAFQPPQSRVTLEMPQPLAYALKPTIVAHIAALIGPPLPARGPPFFA